nr:hypothetical protein [Enterovibrio coralii]
MLERADNGLQRVIAEMFGNDMLVVMADHGNDPFIGHAKHTREFVPVLVYQKSREGVVFGTLETLADVGASAAAFFGADLPQFGSPTLL